MASNGGGGLLGLIRTLFNIAYFFVNLAFRLTVNFGVFGALGLFIYKSGKSVLDLIYWRDPKKSGAVLGVTLLLLLCMATYSVISVAAYLGLTLLAVTVSLRCYKMAMTQLGKPEQADAISIQKVIDVDNLQLQPDRVHKQVDVILEHVNQLLDTLRRLFLIEDIMETVKFGVLLWSLTYLGAWFSGIGLVTFVLIGAFTIPKVYEVYKQPIDQYWNMANEHIQPIWQQITEKLPSLKKKQQ